MEVDINRSYSTTTHIYTNARSSCCLAPASVTLFRSVLLGLALLGMCLSRLLVGGIL